MSDSDDRLRDSKHVFIYAVCGRSASTALQRMLNSSGRICVFGETRGLLDILMEAVRKMREINDRPLCLRDYERLEHSFKKNRHDLWYPSAVKETGRSISSIISLIIDLFSPINGTDRFGFKDISVRSIETLKSLQDAFPNAVIVFLFKDPVAQWTSLKTAGFWPYAKNIGSFLKEYERLSGTYVRFHKAFPGKSLFIENSTMFDLDSLRAFLRKVDIDSFDESLLAVEVDYKRPKKAKANIVEKAIVRYSKAQYNYREMVKLARHC